jgi:hypothetical protein
VRAGPPEAPAVSRPTPWWCWARASIRTTSRARSQRKAVLVSSTRSARVSCWCPSAPGLRRKVKRIALDPGVPPTPVSGARPPGEARSSERRPRAGARAPARHRRHPHVAPRGCSRPGLRGRARALDDTFCWQPAAEDRTRSRTSPARAVGDELHRLVAICELLSHPLRHDAGKDREGENDHDWSCPSAGAHRCRRLDRQRRLGLSRAARLGGPRARDGGHDAVFFTANLSRPCDGAGSARVHREFLSLHQLPSWIPLAFSCSSVVFQGLAGQPTDRLAKRPT